jgi:hypothetical protein
MTESWTISEIAQVPLASILRREIEDFPRRKKTQFQNRASKIGLTFFSLLH